MGHLRRAAPAAELLYETGPLIRTAKELVDRFYGLPVSKRTELIRKLDLLAVEDRTVDEDERLDRALMRARDRGQLLALARAIIEVGG
ncbi:hypothetical protein D3C72_410640 [compost metagenome]